MSNWTKEQVEQVLVGQGWDYTERKIQDGIQFILVDGTPINWYISDKVVVQGKASEIKKKAEDIFNNPPTFPETPMTTDNIPDNHPNSISPNRVFIVHGHDINARNGLELLLYKFNLKPIVLANVPSGGATLIEKLEELTDVDFACVLLTPDDKGHSVKEPNEIKFRARQNVVLELGMVLAKLGRARVAILIKGDELEKPSDISGLIYLPFKEHIDEVMLRLAAELRKAGFNIDVVNLT